MSGDTASGLSRSLMHSLFPRAGLGSFSNKALVSKALEMSLSDEVRAQDSVHFISSIAAK